MALAAGHSSIRCGPLTMHTKTAIHVAEKIMKVGTYNVMRFLIVGSLSILPHFVASPKKTISEQMQSFDSLHLSLLQLEQYAKKNLYASNNWQILVCQVNSDAWVVWWL